jgi:hypothetical protein
MDNTIIEMIEEYMEDKDFFGPADEEKIEKAENTLGIKFPKEYREFIQMYGSGGICGVELVGVENLEASVVQATERYRELSLDKNVVVIQDSGEFVKCMNTLDNDSAVYSWNRGEKKLNIRYESFTEFLIDEFQEAIDNW